MEAHVVSACERASELVDSCAEGHNGIGSKEQRGSRALLVCAQCDGLARDTSCGGSDKELQVNLEEGEERRVRETVRGYSQVKMMMW
jgi:hypothetical protein